MKKITRILMILAISLAALCLPLTVHAGTVKLNKTTVTITAGSTVKLKLKNNKKSVKWSSSNKKIATVSSTGLVKGIKSGTCKITAKVGKKKYKCTVIVKGQNAETDISRYYITVEITDSNVNDIFEVILTHDDQYSEGSLNKMAYKFKYYDMGWYPITNGTDFTFKVRYKYMDDYGRIKEADRDFYCTPTGRISSYSWSNYVTIISADIVSCSGKIMFIDKKAVKSVDSANSGLWLLDGTWTSVICNTENGTTIR